MQLVYPSEFYATGWNIGLKEKLYDFGAIYSSRVCSAAAVFTKNVFPGQPVIVGKENVSDGKLQAIIVNSANANVATGKKGLDFVRHYCNIAAQNLEIDSNLILPSSTGVIARPLPQNPILKACRQLKSRLTKSDFLKFSDAIKTTDAYRKIHSIELESGIVITGVAKGAGMISPNMATMLSYLVTDADIKSNDLAALLQAVSNKSYNRISVDSDTSTSDTVVLLANGASGKKLKFSKKGLQSLANHSYPISENQLSKWFEHKESRDFVGALLELTTCLAKLVAADGEGATKLIELKISGAIDQKQAISVGRSVINSPLVKTAIHGADPNWGRLLMAIGKTEDSRLKLNKITIFFGKFELKKENQSEKELRILSKYLKNSQVNIEIDLGLKTAKETFWGCDLTEDYVRLNSKYTT